MLDLLKAVLAFLDNLVENPLARIQYPYARSCRRIPDLTL